MAINIKIVDGPVNRDILQSIADTYGKTNSRFRSLDFNDKFFNKNAAGPSYHALIYDDKKVVGHLAVLPLYIIDRSQLVLSGKGEALYIEEEYRKETINGIPCALALLSKIHSYAFTKKIVLQHNLAANDVGALYRLNGFKLLLVDRQFFRFFLQKKSYKNDIVKFIGFQVTKIYQYILQKLSRGFAQILGKSVVNISPPNEISTDKILTDFTMQASNEKWTISLDENSLNWRKSIGLLKIFYDKSNADSYLIVTTGKVWEILHWNLTWKDSKFALQVINDIIEQAENENAREVIVDKKQLSEVSGVLKFALIITGFISRSFRTKIFVKSDNKYYCKSENIEFNNLFHFS